MALPHRVGKGFRIGTTGLEPPAGAINRKKQPPIIFNNPISRQGSSASEYSIVASHSSTGYTISSKNFGKLHNPLKKTYFVAAVVENVHGIDSRLALLFQPKYKVDPLVQMRGYILALQCVSV